MKLTKKFPYLSPIVAFQTLKNVFNFDRKRPIIKYIRLRQPQRILEIGVFNGVFSERMLTEAVKKNSKIQYTGVDLFSELQTKENYIQEVSLWADSKVNLEKKLTSGFPQADISLLQGLSSEVLPELIGKEFDLIFIDGGHSESTVKSDWEDSQHLLAEGGMIFFDDYTNRTGVEKAGYGIRAVVDTIDDKRYRVQKFRNFDIFLHSYGLLLTRVVGVSRTSVAKL